LRRVYIPDYYAETCIIAQSTALEGQLSACSFS